MLPNGCSAISRRCFRISGRAASRASMRSSTVSSVQRPTRRGIGRALRLELTAPAYIAIAVLHRRVASLDATVARIELLSAGAAIAVAGRVVAELLLAKQTVTYR